MYLNTTYELSIVVDTEKFNRIFNNSNAEMEEEDDDWYIDHSLTSKGITVKYRDSQYKKKIKFIVNANVILDGDEPNEENAPKLVRKLNKQVSEYFNQRYNLDDFTLTKVSFTTDIDVGSRSKANAYIKVIQRIGKVKGFSPMKGDMPKDKISFWLKGNSNGIEFMIYSLEGLLKWDREDKSYDRRRLASIKNRVEGLLQAEVKLTELRAIRSYTGELVTSNQIAALSQKGERIFVETCTRIIPFGSYHKLYDAIDIIRNKVGDRKLKLNMMRLVHLIPEKKSLLLAQKALNSRRINEIMEAFGDIELSPVTISKRADIKKLDNLYRCMT